MINTYWTVTAVYPPSSDKQRLSSDDCLEVMRESNQTVLTVVHNDTHTHVNSC